MKQLCKLLLAATLLVLVNHGTVRAQGDLSELIKSGPGDATKLASAYLSPLFKGLGIGLNTGWYNTARPKGIGHIEVRVSATGSLVPVSEQSFDVTRLGLSNALSIKPGSPTVTPTLFGSDNVPTTTLETQYNGQTAESFDLPKGIGMNIAPAPQIQATVGLPKGIDATLRMVPKIHISDDFGDVNMIGGGLKFNVLPLFSKVSAFNLALAVGYTQLKYTFPLDVAAPSGAEQESASQPTDFSGQRVDAKFSGVSGELILSKKLLFFTPFVSAGFMSSKTDVGMKGNFPFITDYNTTTNNPVYSVFTNPISIKQTDISGMKGTVGFAMNLLILKIYGSYSLGHYNSFNGGIGIGF
jgi:hypothetical protein